MYFLQYSVIQAGDYLGKLKDDKYWIVYLFDCVDYHYISRSFFSQLICSGWFLVAHSSVLTKHTFHFWCKLMHFWSCMVLPFWLVQTGLVLSLGYIVCDFVLQLIYIGLSADLHNFFFSFVLWKLIISCLGRWIYKVNAFNQVFWLFDYVRGNLLYVCIFLFVHNSTFYLF